MARSREKVTVFPQPIGLAATFNPEALHKAAGMIADEGRAIGPSAPRCQLVRFRRVALEPGERRTLTFRLSTRDLAYVKRLERAIRRGDIVWNGVPYTVESEAMNRALFEGGLALSARLDKRYHRHTVAAKMTDVPGHTRSIIAPLARAGIRFLHVGVNPACTVPGVPPFCRWRDPEGYEIVLAYQQDYGTVRIRSPTAFLVNVGEPCGLNYSTDYPDPRGRHPLQPKQQPVGHKLQHVERRLPHLSLHHRMAAR